MSEVEIKKKKKKKRGITSKSKKKRAIARATLKQGNGTIRINRKLLDIYEPKIMRLKIREPLILAGDVAEKVNININTKGGGIASQTEAARLAIAKALIEFTKSDKLKSKYNDYDWTLLVADTRRKEMRKPNRHGKARAKRQKSYR